MRKLLLITTALLGFALPDPAGAAPIGAWVASAIFGAAAAGSFAYGVVAGIVSMAASAGLSMVVAKLRQQKPRQEAVRGELARPTSLPAYRYVYGKTWAPGTPVGWKVRGKLLYICYLLNSRPSAGPFTVYLDKRAVQKSGNEHDFTAGGGAWGTNDVFFSDEVEIAGRETYVRYWIGTGSQTAPPADIVSGSGGHFSANDAWRGRTVLWAIMHCGGDEARQQRWPATPPELNVDGNWSLVYDPRDGETRFSRNQSLIILDALRRNPVRPYPDTFLRIDTFSWGADVAEELVGVKAGGTIQRYRCDGILTFTDGTEIEDQLQPLLDAGASRLVRVGGRLALIPTVFRLSAKTITEVTTGQPLNLTRWKSSDDLYTEAVARFPAPDRAYESAETPVYVIPGAQAADGGVAKRLTFDLDFVTDHRQAQRICKIMGWRSRMQRQVSGELFPDCFDLVAGSICRVNLGSPFGAWDGKYEVESIAPAAGINDDESITIRLPAVLTETSDEITSWDPTTEERDMLQGDFVASTGRVQPPPKPSIVTGTAAARASGNTTVPGVLSAWTESASASARGYEWEWRGPSVEALGLTVNAWQSGGTLSRSAGDEDGVFVALVPWPETGQNYRIRVRTVGTFGTSDWIYSDTITATGPAVVVQRPPAPEANAVSSSRINIVATQADDQRARAILIYGSDVDNPLVATLLTTRQAGASVSVSHADTGLAAATTRYYYARARDEWGNLSDFSPGGSATTNP